MLGTYLRDVMGANPESFRVFGPDETVSNRLGAVLEATDRTWMAETRPTDEQLAPDGRRDGDALRAPVPGLARGLPADGPSRPVQLLRGLHPHRRLDVQPARQVAQGDARPAVATPDRLAQLRAQLAGLAPGPQRLQPSGPGLHRPRGQQEGGRDPRLPAARRQHPALDGGPLPAQPPLRERHRGRQAAAAELAVDGRGDPPLHAGHRDLGLGEHGRGRRARTSCWPARATSRPSRRWPPST